MDAPHPRLAVEISERPPDLQHAMETAGGKAHGIGRIADEGQALRIGLRHFFQHAGGQAALVATGSSQGRVALAWRSRPGRHRRDLARSLVRRRQDKVGGGDRRHVDHEVDAVEEGPGEPRLVLRDAALVGWRRQTKRLGLAAAAGNAATSWKRAG